MKNVLEFYDHHVTLELYSDNSAARSILCRLGAGLHGGHGHHLLFGEVPSFVPRAFFFLYISCALLLGRMIGSFWHLALCSCPMYESLEHSSILHVIYSCLFLEESDHFLRVNSFLIC